MLIIASPIKRKLGIYKNERISDIQGIYYFMTFHVIRKTTREEYILCLEEHNCKRKIHSDAKYYYEILMD